TYTDLVDERREIIQALLELDCIPSGMELFQAADEDSWSLIKSVIDDCDYYIVVIAGRYGSEHPEIGISYTEMEYRYALEKGMPTIAFLHEDISKLKSGVVDGGETRAKLEDFRKICEKKQVKYWNGAANLGSAVSRSLIRLIKERPAIGWVRADTLASDEAREQVLKMKEEIDSLKADLTSAKSIYQGDITKLAQGGDPISVKWLGSFKSEVKDRWGGSPTLNYTISDSISIDIVFKKISPAMVDEVSESEFRIRVNAAFEDQFRDKNIEIEYDDANGVTKKKLAKLYNIRCADESFQILKVQMMALNLIERGKKRRPPSDKANYWKVTDEGERNMMTLLAVQK
ncbi:MAG: DUF4062 domain-containing protein, partial [Proteobacteria bacterium]